MADAAILTPPENGASEPLGVRVGAGALAAACLSILVIAWRLQPSSAGHGTHMQLGLPPCGFAMMFNKPCFTCGMTTAFAHAAHGQFWAGFKAQPLGLVLAVMTAGVFWTSGYVAATGSRLGRLVADQFKTRNLLIGLGFGLGAWGYKLATWPGL
jgi:hypothetical protein